MAATHLAPPTSESEFSRYCIANAPTTDADPRTDEDVASWMDTDGENMSLSSYLFSLKRSNLDVNWDVVINQKAAKDSVGCAFEAHRSRILREAGFTVRTQVNDTKEPGVAWTADQACYDGTGALVMLEEDKGHYSDKCMTQRALMEFTKTIVNFGQRGKAIPAFNLATFCKPQGVDEMIDFIKLLNPTIGTILADNLHLSYISGTRKNGWWGKTTKYAHCYTERADHAQIGQDIAWLTAVSRDADLEVQ